MTTSVGKLNFVQSEKNTLGRGSYGTTVFSGFHTTSDSKLVPVAIKRIIRTHTEVESVTREVELMQKAGDHPNILRVIDIGVNDDFLFIATELCQGTLEEYVNGAYQGAKFKSEKEILFQVTKGLAHLHEKNKIVHRDIKPTNILIFLPETSPQPAMIKLADFGISKILKTEKDDFTNTSLTTPSGSRGWMPPEVFTRERFDFTVDIWALGCIFAYTLTGGKHPFGDDMKRVIRIMEKEPMVMVKDDLKLPYSKNSVVFELIKSMLAMEPANRPTVGDVKKSSFFIPPDLRRQQFLKVCSSFKNSIVGDNNDQSIKLLIWLLSDESVIDVNMKMEEGNTPLHMLCEHYKKGNLIDLIRLFMEKGARVDAKNKSGEIPLHCLFYNSKNGSLIEPAELFLQKGAEVNTKNKYGETPLHYLCTYNSHNEKFKEIVQLMAQKGANINATDKYNSTPLHELCRHYKTDNTMNENYKLISFIKMFVENGANVDLKHRGKTPFDILRERGLSTE